MPLEAYSLLEGGRIRTTAEVEALAQAKLNDCCSCVDRFFLAGDNPKFAANAQLAARSALFLLICGLPFMMPEGYFEDLDWFLGTGFYTIGVVSFMVLHIKPTLGATMAATVSGIRGVVAAVLNAWFIFHWFPEGYTEDGSPLVWWFGAVEGFLFIFTLVFLNFDMGFVIFSIKQFSGYWMAFLTADSSGFHAPFTEGFRLSQNKGVHDLTCVLIGAVLTLLTCLIPYPLTALRSAKKVANSMTQEVPQLLSLFLDYLVADSRNAYEQDRIQRRLRRLQDSSGSLAADIKNSWWECFGFGSRQVDRAALQALAQTIDKVYDRIYGIWSVAEITKDEVRSERHLKMMQQVRDSFLPVMGLTHELLVICVSSSDINSMTDAEASQVEDLMEQIRQEQEKFRKAFYSKRYELTADQKTNDAVRICLEDFRVDHVVALNVNAIVNLFLDYASAILKQRGQANYLPKVKEESIWSLFEGVTKMENARYSFRVVLSVMLGFCLGYNGAGRLVTPGNAAIAKGIATLLTKFQGSALVKNLSRIQGVVLGTVVGQLLDTLLHDPPCHWGKEVALGVLFFMYIYVTMFMFFHLPAYALMGIQMANFGGTELMKGNCKRTSDPAAAYTSITNNVLSIAIIVAVDLVLAQDRASDMAAAAAGNVWSSLRASVKDGFDKTSSQVNFTRSTVVSTIKKAMSFGTEASNEPRYWRTEWRHGTFEEVLQEMSSFGYALTSQESVMAKGGVDGAEKAEHFQKLLATEHMPALASLMDEKFEVIAKLLSVFQHETTKRWPLLDDQAAMRQFRDEVQGIKSKLIEEITYAEHFKITEVTGKPSMLKDDSMCQICVIFACADAMILSMRQIQHAILRSL